MSKEAKARLTNKRTAEVYALHFSSIARSVFEWKGLPPTCDGSLIEKGLYENGQFCLFKSSGGVWLNLPCSPTNYFNVYGYPTTLEVRGYATGFYERVNVNKFLEPDEVNGVWIRNNAYQFPTRLIVMHYVNRITNIARAQDINVNTLKTPYVMSGDKKDVEEFKKIYEMVENNLPAAIARRSINDNIDIFNTKATSFLSELTDYQRFVVNELLTAIGVNNSSIDRKERVSNLEVESNNEVVKLASESFLTFRQEAAKDISKLTGYDVSVDYRIKEEYLGSEYGNTNGTSVLGS